jgi:hypothetical protein
MIRIFENIGGNDNGGVTKKMEGNDKSIHSLANFLHCKLFMDYFQTKTKQRRCCNNFLF